MKITDDNESDDEPQHRDMGFGTNDNREDVKIVDSKEGVLGSLDNVALTKKPGVGPSNRSFGGRRRVTRCRKLIRGRGSRWVTRCRKC